MLPELPKLAQLIHYDFGGKTLNLLRQRIYAQEPMAGDGIEIDEEAAGYRIHARGGLAALALDFYSTISGSSVTVAQGRVFATDWTGIDPNDPTNSGWTEIVATVAQDTLTVADGSSVWLRLTLTATTIDSTGPLSDVDAESVSPFGGGGGGGGQGGGGGGGAGTSPAGDGAAGAAGSAGSGSGSGGGGGGGDGGAGSGGGVSGGGDGTPGGRGGIGEDGEAGRSVLVYDYANATAKLRYWHVTAAELVASEAQPTPGPATLSLRICERDGSSLIQHQVGAPTLTLPTLSYPPPAS
jgi:hypothetical protein